MLIGQLVDYRGSFVFIYLQKRFVNMFSLVDWLTPDLGLQSVSTGLCADYDKQKWSYT